VDNNKIKRFSTHLDMWLNNLSKTGRSGKQALIIAVDSALIALSLWAAYSLRHGLPFSDFNSTWHLFVFVPMATVIIFMSLGIYRWVIRSSNAMLTRQLIKASIASSLFLILLTYLIPPDRVNPRSLFIIFGMLLILSTGGVRFLWQGIFDSGSYGEPVAIFGAGNAGRQLLNSLSQGSEYQPVLFLDDNSMLFDSMVSGVPVIRSDAPDLDSKLLSLEIERVILAMPSISPTAYHHKLSVFHSLGIPVQTIPSHAELVSGSAKVSNVRDISIADILGRSEVLANQLLLGKCVKNQCVLVSGGGGSIGSELCRQILLQNPSKLIILDHSEENLYKITEELKLVIEKRKLCDVVFLPRLCSVNDAERVAELINSNDVQTIYHAAAYKHVPIIEEQPEQGVQVNIFGTLNILNAAITANVRNFVLISSDKAVRPTNSMGATKRVAELILQAKALETHATRISMVRFGNVLGSSGSVVPKFKKQIDEGGPITLTDPNITRFFMTIPEAAQLVLQAGAIAKGGDVFVLDMGEPMRIEDLAVTMVKLAGKRLKRETNVESDIEIVVQGLRPGEKMFEELFITDSHNPTTVQKVYTADEHYISWKDLSVWLSEINELSQNLEVVELRKILLELAFLDSREEQFTICERPAEGSPSVGTRNKVLEV